MSEIFIYLPKYSDLQKKVITFNRVHYLCLCPKVQTGGHFLTFFREGATRPLRLHRSKPITVREYKIKRHYCTKHASKFYGFEGQLRFDKIEQFKKFSSMHEVFYAYAKGTELVTKLSFKIFKLRKGKA